MIHGVRPVVWHQAETDLNHVLLLFLGASLLDPVNSDIDEEASLSCAQAMPLSDTRSLSLYSCLKVFVREKQVVSSHGHHGLVHALQKASCETRAQGPFTSPA